MKITVFDFSTSDSYKEFLYCHKLDLDIYYQPEFLSNDALIQKGSFEVYTVTEGEDYFLYPYIKVKIANYEPFCDIISPYGYCGPICSSKHFFYKAEQVFLEFAKRNYFLSEFVRYHFYSNEQDLFSININNLHNRNLVVLNLNQSWESVLKSEFSSKNRNLTNKLLKEGFKFEISKSDSDLKQFIQLYYETMKNVGAEDFYYFDPNFFLKLFNDLKDKIYLAQVVKEGVCYCSSLFFKSNGIVTYYLSARNLSYPKVPALNYLLSKVIEHEWSAKAKVVNLGGGRSLKDDDNLFSFKKNFSTEITKFFIGKRVHNHDMYEQLRKDYIQINGLDKFNQRSHILQFYRD